MSNKINLVLEGGGLRGAYTAGACLWLLQHNYQFDVCLAISSGSVHLSSLLLKDQQALKSLSCEALLNNDAIGFKGFLKEGKYVAFDYIFNHLLKNVYHYDVSPIKDLDTKIKIGLYNLKSGQCEYFENKDISIDLLKAACSLPIISNPVKINQQLYFDGGIKVMIPIEESLKDVKHKHLVICTKDKSFVRKKSPGIVKILMKLIYLKYPNILKDYKVRTENYYKQMALVESLVEAKKAVLIRPSKKIKVSRTKADKEAVLALFELGYQDMAHNKKYLDHLLEHTN